MRTLFEVVAGARRFKASREPGDVKQEVARRTPT